MGSGCLLWIGLGEHLGQYITIIKFQGGQEAESKKNVNLIQTPAPSLFLSPATSPPLPRSRQSLSPHWSLVGLLLPGLASVRLMEIS